VHRRHARRVTGPGDARLLALLRVLPCRSACRTVGFLPDEVFVACDAETCKSPRFSPAPDDLDATAAMVCMMRDAGE
jgi:hypothetical protein